MLPSRTNDSTHRQREQAFTLIEVLVSVVILSILSTAILLSLQEVQQGTLATAQYNQALGLATAISEEIKDSYTNSTTGFGITIPGNALGSTTQSPITVSTVPLPPATGATTTGNYLPLYAGFQYQITCSMVSGSTTDATYIVNVETPRNRTASISTPVHALS